MERYEQEHEDNVSTSGQYISCTSVTDEELEMGVSAQMKEYNRKIEFGRILYKIVYMYNLNVYAWGDDMMEVLKACQYHEMSQFGII